MVELVLVAAKPIQQLTHGTLHHVETEMCSLFCTASSAITVWHHIQRLYMYTDIQHAQKKHPKAYLQVSVYDPVLVQVAKPIQQLPHETLDHVGVYGP